jgi:hypothetical protein
LYFEEGSREKDKNSDNFDATNKGQINTKIFKTHVSTTPFLYHLPQHLLLLFYLPSLTPPSLLTNSLSAPPIYYSFSPPSHALL